MSKTEGLLAAVQRIGHAGLNPRLLAGWKKQGEFGFRQLAFVPQTMSFAAANIASTALIVSVEEYAWLACPRLSERELRRIAPKQYLTVNELLIRAVIQAEIGNSRTI